MSAGIQYRGEISRFELSPLPGDGYMLGLWIHIAKLNLDIELGDEGALAFLEDKYPFIKTSPDYYFKRHYKKTCMVEKGADGQFHYAGCLVVNGVF